MKKLYCDVCYKEIIDFNDIKVEVWDGEHPHNGSRMYKNIDVCRSCRGYLPPLKAEIELSDIRKKVTK